MSDEILTEPAEPVDARADVRVSNPEAAEREPYLRGRPELSAGFRHRLIDDASGAAG